MHGWTSHGAMCAGVMLAMQGVEPLRAEPPRPIPVATSPGDPRFPATAVPAAVPSQSQRPYSLWADVLGLSSPPPAALPTQPSQPRSPILPVSSSVRWEVLGRSVEGRVIEFAQFGEGAHQVLVVGALEGDQPEGVAMAEFLAGHLSRFPKRLDDVTITVVRDPNPDGRARRTAVTARGVLINRNFNTPGWQRQGTATGPQPDSEPETRALAELLLDVQPERVVLLGTAKDKTTVGFTGPDEPLARQVALEASAQLLPLETLRQPGSLASYTGDDRGVPTIYLGFVPQANADAIWSANKRAILTAVGCGSPLDFLPVVVRYGPRRPRQATGVPAAQPFQPLVGQTAASVPAEATAPQVLRFQSIMQGLPTVQIDRGRTRPTPQSAFDDPTGPQVAIEPSPQYAAPIMPVNRSQVLPPNVVQPPLERLPPVDLFGTSQGQSGQGVTNYPTTGR